MNRIKQSFQRMPKTAAIIGAFSAGIVLTSILFLVFRSPSKADDNLLPRAARIERVEGNVGLAHTQALPNGGEPNWEEASKNTPLVTGDRVYARDGSRATVAFTRRNYARLDSGSALDILSLADRRTQLALRNGAAIFDVGELTNGELFEVATPNGAFDFTEPGLYQLGIGDNGNTWISVLSGLAQVVGRSGTGSINKGEMLTLVGQAASQILLSKLSPDYAGGLVNDYYGSRYPGVYDGRYSSYDRYLEDPNYYDSYRRSVSYDYVPDEIPGGSDLDDYGDWTEVDGYGHCWAPRVDAGWVPYRDGYWDVGSAYGPTWISQEPWGYAPYHYGRWAYLNNRQWVWVPQYVETQPVYAPALVAFVPLAQTQQIGWVPLAPNEAYIPRYYDDNFQAQYFASPREVAQVINVQHNYVNLNYPQAITVVPVQNFTRFVAPQEALAVNPQFLAQTRPVLDPYAIASLRNVAITGENERQKFKLARAFNEQVLNAPVVASVAPLAVPGRANFNEAMQVETVPASQKKNKLKMQENGQAVAAYAPDGQGGVAMSSANDAAAMQQRKQQVQELMNRSAQGDRAARHELKKMAREQALGPTNAPNAIPGQMQNKEFRALNPQPAMEATQNPRKLQKQIDRQQMNAIEPPRQQTLQPGQGAELTHEQRKAQKRAAVEQRNIVMPQPQATRQQLRAAQPANANAQLEQRRAQKQSLHQQRQMQEQQLQQQRVQEQVNQQRQLKQQRKQQRHMQEQQMQPPQSKQQMKQERRMQEQQVQQQMQRQMQQQQTQQQMKQQRKQQRQTQEQQMRQPQMQPQSAPPAAFNPPSDKQQRKAERRAMQEQQQVQPQPVAPPQPRQKSAAYPGQPRRVDAASPSQRQAEKAQRKAGKGNQ
ncbi:MAG: hypothetical protein HY231_03385 [Acidobacteria bacterium]|nr:hypothetical protein [Acidobacteriota bacterium]